jgi:glycosyltransferase involved in cell wall biosynthesis
MIDKKSLQIAHLVPHAGGGVGTVLRALLGRQKNKYKVTLCSLENLNDSMKKWCNENSIDFLEQGWPQHQKLLILLLKKVDIVHIHWWNHPLLHGLLAYESLPPIRSVIWSHVNGLYVPQFFFDALLSFPSRFICATPQSLRSETVKRFQINSCKKQQIIQSNAGIPSAAPKKLPVRSEFRACYIGTVDYSKMHPEFISLWMKTGIKNKPLVVCGGPAENELSAEISKQNCQSFFDIRGPVQNVPEVLTGMDLFFYPLQHTHYGTGEQVLIEAMAFGVVPIVFGAGCEEFVVENGVTGIVAKSEDEFVGAVRNLYEYPDERKRLARNAMSFVRKKFCIAKTTSKWEKVYTDLIAENDKRPQTLSIEHFEDIPHHSPLALMLTSYGRTPERDFFLKLFREDSTKIKDICFSPALFSKTRGTPLHYQRFFPEDVNLHHLCENFSLLQKTSEQLI